MKSTEVRPSVNRVSAAKRSPLSLLTPFPHPPQDPEQYGGSLSPWPPRAPPPPPYPRPSRASLDGRYGKDGLGEPPTPGTSKMMAVVLVSASRKGFANSQLAPIPLNSNSGGCWLPPCLKATSSNCPSITICRVSISRG